MATRKYARDNQGRFAGAGTPGAKVTEGRAGGFASATHRANVANKRAAKAQRAALVRKGVKVAAAGAGAAAATSLVRRGVGGGSSPARKGVETSNPGKIGKVLSGAVRTVGRAGKSLK